MSYEIERKKIAAMPIAYGNGSGSAAEIPKLLSEILPRVMKHVQSSGGQPAGPPFTHYLKMGETIEFRAGIPLQKPIDGAGDIEAGRLPGGNVLVTTHIGPYDKLNEAYAAMAHHVEEHGLNAGDTMWEFYWTDPAEEPNPENWKTEIFLDLEG